MKLYPRRAKRVCITRGVVPIYVKAKVRIAEIFESFAEAPMKLWYDTDLTGGGKHDWMSRVRSISAL